MPRHNTLRGYLVKSTMNPDKLYIYKQRAKRAFQYADVDSNNLLTKHQYKIASVVMFGYSPDILDINQVFSSCTDNRISYDIFEHWVLNKYPSADNITPAKVLFVLLDTDHKGYITVQDLYVASKKISMRISPSVWQRVFKEWDTERNLICFEESLFACQNETFNFR